MILNILLVLSLIVNIGILFIVYSLFKKDKSISGSVASSIQNLEGTQKQIEYLQNKFRQSLEEIIQKDNLIVQNTSNNIMKYYQDTVTTLTLNYNQNSEKLMALLNEELKKRVDQLVETQAKQLEDSKKLIDNEIKKELVDLQNELKKYGSEKYQEIDQKVYQIISDTAKNTVGKVINIVDHQDLVMNALEQAKKDKFFS